MDDWSDEETDQPLIANHRNFYKVEKWSRKIARAPSRAIVSISSSDRVYKSIWPSISPLLDRHYRTRLRTRTPAHL